MPMRTPLIDILDNERPPTIRPIYGCINIYMIMPSYNRSMPETFREIFVHDNSHMGDGYDHIRTLASQRFNLFRCNCLDIGFQKRPLQVWKAG